MWGLGGSWGWGMWAAGAVLMVLFWAGVIAAVVALVRGVMFKPFPGSEQNRSARDVLAERFARGELSAEEYRRMLQELG